MKPIRFSPKCTSAKRPGCIPSRVDFLYVTFSSNPKRSNTTSRYPLAAKKSRVLLSLSHFVTLSSPVNAALKYNVSLG